MITNMKEKHEARQKCMPTSKRVSWATVREEKEALVPEFAADEKFVYGISYAPSTSITTMESMHDMEMLDAAHMKSDTLGTLFTTITLDADKHIVPLARSIFHDNEAHRTHDLHAKFCMEVYGAHRLNKSTRGRLMDCDKGSLRTHKERYPLTQWMACSWHRSDGVQRHCGVAQKEFFVEAVNALTQAQVAAAKSKMSDKGKAYVNATFRDHAIGGEDKNQFPACSLVSYHGYTVSSPAESDHHANEKVRGKHIAGALFQMLHDQRRYNKSKHAAHLCATLLPPSAEGTEIKPGWFRDQKCKMNKIVGIRQHTSVYVWVCHVVCERETVNEREGVCLCVYTYSYVYSNVFVILAQASRQPQHIGLH